MLPPLDHSSPPGLWHVKKLGDLFFDLFWTHGYFQVFRVWRCSTVLGIFRVYHRFDLQNQPWDPLTKRPTAKTWWVDPDRERGSGNDNMLVFFWPGRLPLQRQFSWRWFFGKTSDMLTRSKFRWNSQSKASAVKKGGVLVIYSLVVICVQRSYITANYSTKKKDVSWLCSWLVISKFLHHVFKMSNSSRVFFEWYPSVGT